MFRAFARTVDAAQERFVVLDTAPTGLGHTLLLLDAALSYHREVQRTQATVPGEVAQLLKRLRDPGFARMLLITLAESTPVHEAERNHHYWRGALRWMNGVAMSDSVSLPTTSRAAY